jgi:phosphoglycolate phosphatase-like HAD superfamily hydrolase
VRRDAPVLRGVLVDVGGTLWRRESRTFDTRLEHLTALSAEFGEEIGAVLEEHASSALEAGALRIDTAGILRAGLASAGISATTELVETYRKCLVHSPVGRNSIMPGADELLETCAALGLKVAIVPNAFARTGQEYLEDLRTLGLSSRILETVSVALSSVDVGARKPLPDLLLAATDELGVTPEESIMIGDSLANDAEAAARANIRFEMVGFRDGGSLPLEAVIRRIRTEATSL